MKKKLMILSGLVLGSTPFIALAQVPPTNDGTVFGVLRTVGNFLNAVVPVLIALGIVYFVWGVITYVISSDEEAKKSGRDRMIFGIIGLAVIVGMWGLVNILGKTFGIQSGANPTNITLPGVNFTPTATP